MEQENVGAVVVVERERPVGIITDRDVALAVCLHGAKSFDAVQTRMTCRVDTIREDEGVYNATHKMLELAVRRARR
jgi:signal-transduction protein with cAMP-binding, CBS, and nucleotidyltransferase domain